MKYRVNEFKVCLVWFADKGVGRRTFKKYKDAVAWAEQYLKTDLISVRILGTLSAEENNVGGNDTLPFRNGG